MSAVTVPAELIAVAAGPELLAERADDWGGPHGRPLRACSCLSLTRDEVAAYAVVGTCPCRVPFTLTDQDQKGPQL